MLISGTGKRDDPRVRRTRGLLHRALRELMGEKSFQSITVLDIAERATVNRATFYAHFADKYALLEYSTRETFRERLRGVLPAGSPFSTRNLELLIRAVCEFLAEMSGACPPPHAQYEPLMEKQVKVELTEVLRLWLAEKAPKQGPGAAPDLAAVVASWSIYGAAVQWSQQERREPAGMFAQRVLPLIHANLAGARLRAARRRRAS